MGNPAAVCPLEHWLDERVMQLIARENNLSETAFIVPDEVYQSTFDLLCIFNDEVLVKQAKPDLNAVANMFCRGIILSAPALETDVYSRCFYPGCDVPEDPVTGSAHCVIAPYWCTRLNKKKIHACQGGTRQGELWCEVDQNRVLLSGYSQLYLQGQIRLPSV